MKHSQLSSSFEDYLEAIYMLEIEGKPIKSIDIAKMIGVSRPAVNKAMNELLKKNYIEKPPYGEITLTDEGREIAKKVYHVHVTIREFLIKIGVNKDIADVDCCLIEHVISKETLDAIEKFIKK